MAVNLKHQFFAAQIAAQSMREIGGGSIINFSSTAWMIGSLSLAVYAAAKAAVIGLTNSLAHELGGDNIRVNCIAPGAVMTERQRRLWFTTEADVARDGGAPMPSARDRSGGGRQHGAVSRRRRQPDDHQALPGRRRRPALIAPHRAFERIALDRAPGRAHPSDRQVRQVTAFAGRNP